MVVELGGKRPSSTRSRHEPHVSKTADGAAWAEAIYEDGPPPRIEEWTNPRYRQSLVKGSPLHGRLGFLAAFLFDQKLRSKPIEVGDAMDVSAIMEALKTQRSGS